MSDTYLISGILVSAIATYLTRILPFASICKKRAVCIYKIYREKYAFNDYGNFNFLCY